MNHLYLLLLLSFVAMTMQACAQAKAVVARSDAYYIIPTPGNIQVNESGEPVNTLRDSVFYLYVETSSDGIKWQQAWKGPRSFSVIPTKLAAGKTGVGKTLSDDREIAVAPQPGNVLWQIELSDDQQRSKAPQPLAGQEILLSGKKAGQLFYVRIKSVSELASPIFP